ncbi:hypothetical protein BacF7301_13300 [Bacteroides faecium]|uniref:Transmembrane protein n=1 Tax=Bacteroides faecium TaxID=2715212 RepID=A0A6H0KYG6_9BACE|nr:hypothetical protein BacF7301_13300 [Bacteroides faecium]
MKIILIILLLICLAPMPYGYYTLIRYLSAIVFTIMAYDYGKNQKTLCMICVILVGLFQPVIKIPLGREVWNLVDILVAVFLLLLLERKIPKNKEKS